MTRVKLDVPGIKCGGCVSAVESALEGIQGATDIEVSLESKTAEVTVPEETQVSDVVKAVADAGYPASPR